MVMMIMTESSDGWAERAAAASHSQRLAAVGRLASAKIAALVAARRDWQQHGSQQAEQQDGLAALRESVTVGGVAVRVKPTNVQ